MKSMSITHKGLKGGKRIMEQDVSLWRMNIMPNTQVGLNAFEFCLRKGIIGFGWQLKSKPENILDCKENGRKEYPGETGFVRAINAFKEMKVNDLVWIRHIGLYYLCKVLSQWEYCDDTENISHDIVNIVHVEIYKVGTVESVPAKVVNSFRRGSTVQQISEWNSISLKISKSIFNEILNQEIFYVDKIETEHLLDAFLPEDVEDIVILYLQFELDYLLYSSSNKIDTQTYECVMVNRKDGHLCYPQVKTGNISLNGNNYSHLVTGSNRVYLFATCGIYDNLINDKVIELKREIIMKFIIGNPKLMPKRVRIWMEK